MQHQEIGAWLDDLASSAPAPGGGAVAAMQVAMAAALVEMVANLTIGNPRYAEHEQTMIEAREQAGEQRRLAMRLAEEDARAFTAVTDAYKLPKGTDAEKAARSARIQQALLGAADVPWRTAQAAATVLDLAERILPGANVNVLSDVAVAASSARAGLEAAIVNIEVNRAAIKDEDERARLGDAVASIERDLDRATAVVASVRKGLDR
ncbi:MAG TPA: cyclodeaminase/cyclohydrolase family protein [Planosporangium sp.]|nr:cyclodeaminase/cyclohydrolase family protein [Planosporangium sp.]